MSQNERAPIRFREATPDDIPTIADLGFHSFPMAEWPAETREQRLRENPEVRIENYLLGEVDGRVVTSMNGIAFTTWIGGRPQSMLGVASVAVSADARRRGYAKALVVESMRRSRARGTTISALYPFRFDFYASLGYATTVEKRFYEFRPSDLPVYPERERARRSGPDDLPSIMQCYRRVIQTSTLMVERSESWWRRIFEKKSGYFGIVFEGSDGAVRGYIIYRYEEFPEGRLTRLRIPELVAEDQEARRGLLGYVAALQDQFVEAAYTIHDGDRLELRLSNPRRNGANAGSISGFLGPTVQFGAMARVLDVAGALRARDSYSAASGAIRLSIADSFLSENSLPLDLTFRDGALDVAGANVSSPASPSASMDIGVFTQLYLGCLTASEAREMGFIQADDDAVSVLDRAFRGPKPALIDQF